MSEQPASGRRDHWAGRSAFILAAIGSAVGLGNLWGFPYKLYTYGGGAFLIPYFIAMLVMGIPLLIMEFSVGHWAQQSPPGAFKRVMKKYRFVGWWLVGLAFVIITYYAVILGWCVNYLVMSIGGMFGQLPWAGGTTAATAQHAFERMVGTSLDNPTFTPNAPALWVVLGTAGAWALVYLCLFKGVGWVSRVVLITVPLPWMMLVILTVRGLTLEGAVEGLEFYLEPRWDKLAEPETWRFAFGQVFFSMSLGFAVMLSYASFLHRRSDLNNNALIIGLGDLGTSFVAGIAVFSMLGGMAHALQQAGQPTAVPDLVPSGTVGLSFIVFPFGLAQLPWAGFFSTVFFIALLTLGIDSAFSIVEACLASVCDVGDRFKRSVVLPIICIVGFLIGLLFTTEGGGLFLLDFTDGMINGPFGILIVALAECLIVGWAWRGKFLRTMRDHANERSDWKLYIWWDIIIKFIAPAFLAILFTWSLSGIIHAEIDAYLASAAEGTSYPVPWPLIVGSVIFLGIPVAAWLLTRSGNDDPPERGGVRWGIGYVAAIVALSAITIELGPIVLAMIQDFLPSSVGAAAGPKAKTFAPDGQLNGTAYTFIAVALVVIFGGLAWCFWRAMIAAGQADEEIEDQVSI